MPFPHRLVTPVKLVDRAEDEKIERLEDVNIIVLGNLISQMERLSEHATDIITNISQECDLINNRTSAVITRVSKLREDVDNYTMEGKENADVLDDPIIHPNYKMDCQLFSPNNRPKAVEEQYSKVCDYIIIVESK